MPHPPYPFRFREAKPRRPPPQAVAASPRSLLLGALGAAVVLLGSGRTWAEGAAAAGGGRLPLDVEGQDVTGAPAALAVVALAALVAGLRRPQDGPPAGLRCCSR